MNLEKEIEKLDKFDPNSIDYTTEDPNAIEDGDIALKIYKHLQGQDLSIIEQIYLEGIMDKFGIVKKDPTILDREGKILIASSFKHFVKYMFLVEYGFEWKSNWHHDLICDKLNDIFLGRGNPRLIINIPPRYSKTQILIYWVAWTMGSVPDSEYILVGYSKRISENSSYQIREIIDNPKYQSIFPTRLSKSGKAKDSLVTTKNGKVYATSVSGSVTGRGAGKRRKSFGGAIIADDPNNSTDAFSKTLRDSTNDWFANTLASRRNNKKITAFIIVQQRVHESDVSGYILPNEAKPNGGLGEEFEHLIVPAVLTKEQMEGLNVPKDSDSYKFGDPIADEYPLWQETISLEDLKIMRSNLPMLTFQGQYQQIPYASDGEIFNPEWIGQRLQPNEKEIKYRVFVIDTAQTVTNRSDYSVIMVACVMSDGSVHIEDIYRKRVSAPDLTDKIVEMYKRYRPAKIYIEYKSSGISLVQYLKKEGTPLPIEKIARNASAGDGDKVTRGNSISTYVKNGYVTIKEGAPWLSTFMHELVTFPTGAFDDQVDTMMDLVQKEVVKGVGYLHSMDGLGLTPIRDTNYNDLLEREPEDDMASILGGFMDGTDSDLPDWALGIIG